MAQKKEQAERFYWDSCTFLAWLLPEEERRDSCKEVIESAVLGECLIVTSALTLTEVVKLRGLPPLKEDQEDKIRRFFENNYIVVRQVDRFIAEDARRLIWAENVRPKDSIHVATALRWKIEEFHTYDDKLIGLSDKLGDPLLKICEPAARQKRIIGQGTDSDTSTEAAQPSGQSPVDAQAIKIEP